jgi:hypothetical protein
MHRMGTGQDDGRRYRECYWSIRDTDSMQTERCNAWGGIWKCWRNGTNACTYVCLGGGGGFGGVGQSGPGGAPPRGGSTVEKTWFIKERIKLQGPATKVVTMEQHGARRSSQPTVAGMLRRGPASGCNELQGRVAHD